ncbi:transcriptional regulator [Natronoarchaeum sp. GCM10025321]|uniref:transcriptional regulator n=1 Tax=Natronoarchaeum sp. GCM10025321 TaxID=3252684 RepID=UPI003608F163
MHTCRICNQTFSTKLKLELHRDTCKQDTLLCEQCGDKFSEAAATRDGWHYRCPNDDCDGEGLTEDLYRLNTASVERRS